MTAYATVAQLGIYLETAAPSGADRLLERASDLMDSIVLASFDVGDDDLPTDAAIATALQNAVCAQVKFWTVVGEENSIDGLAGTQVQYGGVFTGQRAPDVAPRAREFLRLQNLLRPS